MDRKEFLSRTLHRLDLIFVPSSMYRSLKREGLFEPIGNYDQEQVKDCYSNVLMFESIRFTIELAAVAGFVYYLSN